MDDYAPKKHLLHQLELPGERKKPVPVVAKDGAGVAGVKGALAIGGGGRGIDLLVSFSRKKVAEGGFVGGQALLETLVKRISNLGGAGKISGFFERKVI